MKNYRQLENRTYECTREYKNYTNKEDSTRPDIKHKQIVKKTQSVLVVYKNNYRPSNQKFYNKNDYS